MRASFDVGPPFRIRSRFELSEAFSEPLTVQVVENEVVVLGPNGVGLSLTPAAAEETGRRLIQAADEARAEVRPM